MALRGCGRLDKSDAGVLDHAAELLRTVEHVARLVVGRAVQVAARDRARAKGHREADGQILEREFPEGLESELDRDLREGAGDL